MGILRQYLSPKIRVIVFVFVELEQYRRILTPKTNNIQSISIIMSYCSYIDTIFRTNIYLITLINFFQNIFIY
jgi:hypothetical protein